MIKLSTYYGIVYNNIVVFKGSKTRCRKKLKNYPESFIIQSISKKTGDKWRL